MRSAYLSVVVMAVALAGCGQGRGTRLPESGDPEADQRAAMRVGSESDSGQGTVRRTLYERLGGEQTLRELVDDFTARVIADPRVNFERLDVKTHWYGGTYKPWQPTPDNLAVLKRHMVEFLTLATGGPAAYSGRDIREVHKGMQVTNTEFDAMVGDVKTSMDRMKIPAAEKKDLLAIIETTRKEIVEKR